MTLYNPAVHLPPKQKTATIGAGILMLAGLSYVGTRGARPDAPMSVVPISSNASPVVNAPVDAKAVEASTPTPTEAPKPLEMPKPDAPKEVVVALVGAVKVPGLLHMPPDARVDDAVKRAGGAKPDADLEGINLAAKLVDGDQVYVPHRKAAEPEKAAETAKVATRYRGGEVSPHYAPLAPAMPPPLEGSPLPSAVGTVAGHEPRAAKAKASGPVSLNTGSLAQLETLPGVGPATAQKILDYRQEHGGFGSVDEIQAVKGIGPKKFEKMRAFLKP